MKHDLVITLVVNPTAGRGKAAKILPKVCSELLTASTGIGLRLETTQDYDHAGELCEAALKNSDVLLVMGGDGMVQAGLNACAGTDIPLGIVPAGTGNDFCRGVGIPKNPVAAVKAILTGRTRAIDLMKISDLAGENSRYVGSILSTGFDARVNRRKNLSARRSSSLAYLTATLSELRQFKPIHYEFSVDGKPYELESMLVAIGNAGYFGGGMHVCPKADVTDGLLDVTIVRTTSAATLVRLLPQIYSGKFIDHPAVELVRGSSIVLHKPQVEAMADGEFVGWTPMMITVEPEAVTLIG